MEGHGFTIGQELLCSRRLLLGLVGNALIDVFVCGMLRVKCEKCVVLFD